MAKLTIITAVLNDRVGLEATAQSVADLHRDDVRFVVIDGGSDDGTLEFIKSSTMIDQYLSEQDNGVYHGMNKGWAMAEEDSAILFLGAGDKILSLPHSIDLQAITYGTTHMGKVEYRSSLKYNLKAGNSLHHQSLIIPKSLHPEPPFDLNFPCYADYDFNQRLLLQGCRFNFSSGLTAYAEPAGISSRARVGEMAKVSAKNYGLAVAVVTALFSLYSKVAKK